MSKWWWIAPILGLAVALAFVLREGRKGPVTSPTAPASVPVTEARKLANQAMQLLEDPNFTRETSWLADELCQRALALDAGDAEVWAVAALASNNLYGNTYDHSASRREKARSQAARASQLDPQSIRAALASARCLEGTGNDAEVRRILRELHRRAPTDQHVIFSLIEAERSAGDEAAAQDLLRQLRALPRTGVLPLTLWFTELRLRMAGRYAEAEQILDELLAGPEVLRGAYYEKLNLLMRSWHDLADAGAFIEKIPARFRQEPAFGSAIAYYQLWRREPEIALRALDQVPQDYFEEYAAREPKALLTGWAHSLAGRSAAAQAEWRNALALVDERLKSDGRNFVLLSQRALLLALTGQSAAAREAWQLRVELGAEDRPAPEVEAQVLIALGDADGALTALERGWYQLKPGVKGLNLPTLRYHPAFASLQGDPRLQRILADGAATLATLRGPQTSVLAAVAPASDEKSVAVLAFANLSDDKANEYFSDGISEELLNVLAKVPGLKVSARTSAFYFKGKEVPIPEIAKQLGVAYVVEGIVRKAGDKVRITAQLIKAADGFHVWSDTFTRDLKDIFAVQDEIAGLIAQNLKLGMGLVVPAARREFNPEAHRLLLEGRYFWNLRTREGFDRAEAAITKAIELDPQFAQAYAGLADVRWVRTVYASYSGANFVLTADPDASSERAQALDPTLAEAYPAVGAKLHWTGRTGEAGQQFKKAIALNPNYALAHHWYALVLEGQGRLDEALAEIDQAVQLDPLSVAALSTRLRFLLMVGRIPEALAVDEKMQALRPAFFLYVGVHAQALLAAGRRDEALAAARSIVASPDREVRYVSDAMAVHVLRMLGHEAEAVAHVEKLLPRLPADSYLRGVVLAALDRWDEAMPYLERTPPGMCEIFFWNPMWDRWREDPRFGRLLAKLNCTEEYKVARATLVRMQGMPGATK